MFNLDENKHQAWAAQAVRKPLMNPRKPDEQLDPDLFATVRGSDCVEFRNTKSQIERLVYQGADLKPHEINARLAASCVVKIEGLTDSSGKEVEPDDYVKLLEDYPALYDSLTMIIYDRANFTPPAKD